MKKSSSVLVLILSFFIIYLYVERVQEKCAKEQERLKQEYVKKEQTSSAKRAEELKGFLEYAESQYDEKVKLELKLNVHLAYELAHEIYEKNRDAKRANVIQEEIKEALSHLGTRESKSHIYLKDLKGNPLVNARVKIANREFRGIDLEELQKVKKSQEGFLEYKDLRDKKHLIYVKNLGLYNWYIGGTINLKAKQEQLKSQMLNVE